MDRYSLQLFLKAVDSCGKWQACQAVRRLEFEGRWEGEVRSYLRPAPPLGNGPLERHYHSWNEKRTGTFRDTSSPLSPRSKDN